MNRRPAREDDDARRARWKAMQLRYRLHQAGSHDECTPHACRALREPRAVSRGPKDGA